MPYITENSKIGISESVASNIEVICNIENDQENKYFIKPYDKHRHQQAIESKDEMHLTVWDKTGGNIIGFIILAGLENQNLSLELRRTVVQIKGKGFGRICLQLIKEYCFRKLNFHRLWLDVFDDNERALNLYRTEGFQIDGYLREVVKQGDNYRTLILLSMLESEFINH